MAIVDVKVFYLEMLAWPTGNALPLPAGAVVLHAKRPTVAYYRFLYNAVGKDYHWLTRGRMADAELDAVLANPLNEVHVLHIDGSPAGFAELDRRVPGEIEIVQFGLIPGFIGKGLGKGFLRWTVEKARGYAPNRLWLHTCTLDHPAALPNYLKGGFAVYEERMKKREL